MNQKARVQVRHFLLLAGMCACSAVWAEPESTAANPPPLSKAEMQQLVEAAVTRVTDKPLRPRFTALKVRIPLQEVSKDKCNEKLPPQPEPDNGQAEVHTQPLKCKQIERDKALVMAFRANSDEQAYLHAYQKILVVCNDGMDQIASQITDNVRRDTRFLFLAAAAGLISGGTGSLVAAKTAGVLAAGTAAYKQAETLTPGTQYNNQTQQAMAEEIRQELAEAMGEFNRWLLAPETDETAKVQRKKGLTYSLIAMNNACMFY